MPSRAAAAAVLALGLASAAPADFTGFSVLDVSTEVGTPIGLRTWRVVVHFDDPADRVLGVGSGPDGFPMRIATDDPLGFRNEAGPFAGLPEDDFPNVPLGRAWDSWVALGGDTLETGNALLSPGFAGGAIPAISGTEIVETNGGWLSADPSATVGSDPVIIGQFTIDEGSTLEFDASVAWSDPDVGLVQVRITNCPGALNESILSSTAPASDLDGDGVVGFGDLTALLSRWGSGSASWSPLGGAASVSVFLDACAGACLSGFEHVADGFGSFADGRMESGPAGEINQNVLTNTRVEDDHTVIAIGGGGGSVGGTGCEDAFVSGSATAERVFVVHEPTAFELQIITCENSTVRLDGPDGNLAFCAGSSGVLAPGTWTFRGSAGTSAWDGDRDQSVFTARLRLFDGGAGVDVDGDGVAGDFGDLLTILGDWGRSTG